MGQLFWPLALLALLPVNYAASRAGRPRIGKLVLIVTSLPAIAAIMWSGFLLAYAIINADEVNRRFRQGDLTYFGTDIAFFSFLLFGGLWVFLAYVGFRWGHSDRRTSTCSSRASPPR